MKEIKMATVLSDELQTVERARSPRDPVLQKGDFENSVSEPSLLSPNRRILVPITDGSDSKTKEVLQYAASFAKRYGMKITLVCAIPDLDIPEGYASYARAEGIGDYYYLYIESVSNAILSKWSSYLEKEGVESDSLTYLGKMKDAVREGMKLPDVGLVVVRPSGSRKGLVNRILHPTFLGAIPFRANPNSHAPILVVS